MTSSEQQQIYWEGEKHGYRDCTHPVIRAFSEQRLSFLSDWISFNQLESALDVGCGNGFSSYYMSQLIPNVWAVDRSHSMLRRHPLIEQRRLSLADGRELPFPDNSFDLVYCWEVLHHIDRPELVLAEMTRISRRYVLVAEPNRNNPAQFAFALLQPEHRWVLRFSLRYLEGLFNRVGLEVPHSAVGGWLFPNVTPVWLSSFILRLPYSWPLGISNWVLGIKR